ncbi:MAG: hypothetical protein V4590_13235 [Bacteroidota bacterium]
MVSLFEYNREWPNGALFGEVKTYSFEKDCFSSKNNLFQQFGMPDRSGIQK